MTTTNINTQPTIVIADDSEESLRLLTRILRKQDYLIRHAVNGEQVLEIVADSQPDLVILDIMMPLMNGYEVCAALKSDPAYAHIPVIFISAMASPDDVVRGFEVGGADYITKPYRAVEVVARVSNQMELARLRQQDKEYIEHLNHEVQMRREAESMLMKSEARLWAVVEDQTEFIVRYTPDFIMTFCNTAYGRYFGKSPEELINTSLLNIIPPEDHDQLREHAAQLQPHDPVQIFEHPVIDYKGDEHYHQWTDRGVFDSSGELTEIQSVGRDITSLKRAEDRLLRSEANMRAILDSTDTAYTFIKPDYTIITANRIANHNGEITFGKSMFPGMDIHEFVQDKDLESFEAYFAKALRGHESRVEREYPQQNGASIWLEVRYYPVKVDEGEIMGVLLSVENITERKTVETEHFEMELTRQRIQLLADFIKNTAHEFRTPLAAISTGVYLMQRTSDAEKRERQANRILSSIDDISSLLDTMLKMVELDHGVKEIQFSPVNLKSLVTTVLGALDTSRAAKEHQVELHFEDTRDVCGNASQLYQALFNIIENAIRFTPNGGKITVQTRTGEDEAKIVITDTGIGMSPQVQKHIFEHFYRADEARTQRGFGLGLSIAEKIISLHGGTIEVESVLKEGTTVTVRLTGLCEPRHTSTREI